MKGFQTKLDVIGNNIANVNTAGYKKSTVNFQDLLSQNMSGSGANPMQVGLGSKASSINTIHTAGSSLSTGVGTDLSIQGEGYFVVQAPGANERFMTRAGNFTVAANGDLVTPQGYNVLGIYPPAPAGITGTDVLPDGPDAINVNEVYVQKVGSDPAEYEKVDVVSHTINGRGEIIGKTADGREGVIASIAISAPENPAGLRQVGGSLYAMTGAAGGSLEDADLETVTAAKTAIGSGMLEMSNVDLTEEFTEMIVAQRGFQANSRTITTSDEILQEVVNLKR